MQGIQVKLGGDGARLAWMLALLCCVTTGCLVAQGPAARPSSTVAEELGVLSRQAATVFVGQVTSITRETGVVQIDFRVEQSVLGGASGSYVLREWAGLWPPGQSRYWPGERALLFLHGSVGGGGFSGPVLGSEGVVPVVVAGAQAPELLDLRRLQASLLRRMGAMLPTGVAATMPLSVAVALITTARNETRAEGNRPVAIERTHVPTARVSNTEPTGSSHAR